MQRLVLLPTGEGAPKGRMRVSRRNQDRDLASARHRGPSSVGFAATFSRGEKEGAPCLAVMRPSAPGALQRSAGQSPIRLWMRQGIGRQRLASRPLIRRLRRHLLPWGEGGRALHCDDAPFAPGALQRSAGAVADKALDASGHWSAAPGIAALIRRLCRTFSRGRRKARLTLRAPFPWEKEGAPCLAVMRLSSPETLTPRGPDGRKVDSKKGNSAPANRAPKRSVNLNRLLCGRRNSRSRGWAASIDDHNIPCYPKSSRFQ